MRDLRILEEQQRDSQRKLVAAQEAKQRRQQQHAALEAQLGELKYQNGQSRAELQSMRDTLAREQRKLSVIRNQSESAGDDLHNFDRYVRLDRYCRTRASSSYTILKPAHSMALSFSLSTS